MTIEKYPSEHPKFVERKSNQVRDYQSRKYQYDSPFLQNRSIMATSIITTDDLRDFKMELLDDIKKILNKQASSTLKKYLKSSEVMEMLRISPGTLQNLRINGTLPFSKMGGIIYYDSEDIQKVMLKNRVEYTEE